MPHLPALFCASGAVDADTMSTTRIVSWRAGRCRCDMRRRLVIVVAMAMVLASTVDAVIVAAASTAAASTCDGADVDATAAAQGQGQAVPARSAAAPALAEAARAFADGDAARALKLAAAYVERRPADPKGRVLLARIHIGREAWDDAYAQLRLALQAAPRNADVLEHLGVVAGRMAQHEFQRLYGMAPDSARVHQLMAESLEAQERRTEAETEYEAALRAKPDLLDALLGLARLKRIRLDCDGAMALYAKAEAIRPTYDGAYGLGSCSLRLQDDKAALARFEEAVERDPRAALAWVGLGSTLLRFGRTAEAIEKLRRATTLEPDMRDAWYMLGRAYQTGGDKIHAQDAFAKAEQLRTGSTQGPR